MSYPKDRRERFLIGKRKGERRAKGTFTGNWINQDHAEIVEHHARRMRNTTKLCSCDLCGDPRKHFGRKTIQELRDF